MTQKSSNFNFTQTHKRIQNDHLTPKVYNIVSCLFDDVSPRLESMGYYFQSSTEFCDYKRGVLEKVQTRDHHFRD